MYRIADDIRENGIQPKHIRKLVEDHEKDRERMIGLYNRYKEEEDAIPIFQRDPINIKEDFETGGNVRRIDTAVNNKLNNAFHYEIVDGRVGYLHGIPITYDLDQNSTKNEQLKRYVENFLIRNNVDDRDSELGKMAAICGYGARLAYIDYEGDVRIKNINPYNAIFIGEDISEPEYSLFYVWEKDEENGNDILHAEFYDDTYYYTFEGDTSDNAIELSRKPHMFDYNPLFGVVNNEELKGDAERVLHLIDGYNMALSDASSEITQTRLAYIVLRGMGLDEEMIHDLNKTGAFELFDKDMDVSYLTKDVNDTMIENHLNRLEKNIMRFSNSVNFNTEEFNGNVPIIGMKLKLMSLENKCMTFERKMTAMLRYQFKVILSALKRKGMNINKDTYLDVFFKFTRNIPINKLEEAQVLSTLNGQVSDRTRLSQSSFVDDVDYELDEIEKERIVINEQLPNVEEGLDDEQRQSEDKQPE